MSKGIGPSCHCLSHQFPCNRTVTIRDTRTGMLFCTVCAFSYAGMAKALLADQTVDDRDYQRMLPQLEEN